MLPKTYRLTRERDFEIVSKEGFFVSGRLVNAKVWCVSPEKYPRRGYSREEVKFGFVVSKKVDRRAVVRNRVKRQMREVVRLLVSKEAINPGFLIVLLVKKEIVGKSYGEIADDIHSVLLRSRVVRRV